MSRPGERRVTPRELSQRTLHESLEIDRVMRRAVRRAREENRRLGIPNVSVRDGMIVEELPDGTVKVVGPVAGRDAETPRRTATASRRRAS